MKRKTLDLLCCPQCRAELELHSLEAGEDIEEGELACQGCSRIYPIHEGIPEFIRVEELIGLDKRFSHLYDIFSYVYIPWSRAAFSFLGGEKLCRRELVERMCLHGGNILEVSIGPGPNLPFPYEKGKAGMVFELDISPRQLKRCKAFARRGGWEVELFLGTAEQLPFRDNAFETVFHLGGINFFNDKTAAVNEMIRTAKPGTRLLIGDENEKGAKFNEGTLPGFSSSFKDKRASITAPVDLIPTVMENVTVGSLWKGYFYSISFTKPG
jgi:ubiquinone/menaquinone biosynthesis C-methylase UbiE/uncharacterized protein YbaR (Trm112 family)